MNSVLNPDAAEFVLPEGPVTPVKAVPRDLLDDKVIHSPTWANMDSVVVPPIENFLEEAKNRPGDIELDPNVEPFEVFYFQSYTKYCGIFSV